MNAQKRREERERIEREKAEKEREGWDRIWTSYQARWSNFRASSKKDGNSIPWPVAPGLSNDWGYSIVREFFVLASPRDADMGKLMRKEARNWHPDTQWLKSVNLTDVDLIRIGMICRVVTELMNEANSKSATFWEAEP